MEYKILKNWENGYLSVEFIKPVEYKNDFPQRWEAGHKIFLIKEDLKNKK